MTTSTRFKIAITFLFIVPFLNAQEKFQIPKHANGSPVAIEKFEMLEHALKKLAAEPEETHVKTTYSKPLESRNEGETQVGVSNDAEFEIHAAVNPTNSDNIIVGSIQFSQVSFGISIYMTMDKGKTWTKSNFNGNVGKGISGGGGDPVIVFDDRGVAYLTWLLISLDDVSFEAVWGFYSAVSDDGGLSWTLDEEPIVETEFTDPFFFSDLEKAPDKQWMVSDLSSSSPHTGNIYMAYLILQSPNSETDLRYEITFTKKKAGDLSFETDSLVLNTENYPVSQFTSLDVDNDGNIYVTFLGDETLEDEMYSFYVVSSTDGGETFSPEKKIQTINFPEIGSVSNSIEGIPDARFYPCPHLAIDKSGLVNDGRMYFTFTANGLGDTTLTEGYDVYLMYSDDKGESWSEPQIVNDDPNPDIHQFYSTIAVNEIGDVILCFYDRRNHPTNADTDYFMAISKDGGESFLQFALNSVHSDFTSIGDGNMGIGIGEYTQVVTAENYAIPFWADGRTNNGDIAIYSYIKDTEILSNAHDNIVKISSELMLDGPFPNPASNEVELKMILSSPQSVSLSIFDLNGALLRKELTKNYSKGEHILKLDINDLPGGEYFITAETDQLEQVRKLIVK